MTVVDLLWSCLLAATMLVVPGALLAWLIGLRGLWLYAAAAPFSATVVSLASLAAPFVGLAWGVLPVAIVTVVLGAVLALVRRLLRRMWPTVPAVPGSWPWSLIALVAAGVLLAIRAAVILPEPTSISQTFDNVFHLNAIRYVIDTGSASPLDVVSMSSSTQWFYPATWHAFAALIVELGGASIPVAANAVWIVTSVLVWPASVLVLTRTLFGARPAVLLVAGIASAAVPAFPILLIDYGVLYPLHLSVALLPVAVAATVELFRLGRDSAGATSAPALWVVAVLGSLPGLALAHPGGFMAWLALATPIVVVAFVIALRGRPPRARVIGLSVALAAYLAAGFAAVRILRPPAEASMWPTSGTAGQAIGEVATVSLNGAESAVVVAVAMVIGIVVAARRRTRADVVALAMFGVVAGLYVIVAGIDSPFLRFLTAPWYNNIPRLAGILVVMVVPFAAYGAAAAWSWLTERRSLRRVFEGGRPAGIVVAAAVLVVFVGLSQLGPINRATQHARASYTLSDSAALLSTDELALIERLPELVPEDAAIAGSPWTGTALAYALADRRVLMPHTLSETTPDIDLINDELAEATEGSAVCAALDRERAEFVLVFGGREVHGGVHEYRGLDELEDSDAVALVDEVGDARLYEITACS